MKYLVYFAQSVVLISLSPLFIGIIKNLKGLMRGYIGPSIFQPYYNLKKLFHRSNVVSDKSSFITLIAPILSFTAVFTAAFLVPVFYSNGNSFFGNIFIIVFILALVKLFSTLLGLDAASTFGGMGSSRELFISIFAEPVIFIIIAFLFLETKSFNIFDIALINSEVSKYTIAHIMGAMAFAVVIIAENLRMPVDNPETHLELTMIHEAMILDISGKDLAFMELASYIKLTVFITIFINCFFPIGITTELNILSLGISLIVYILKVLGILIIVAAVESSMAKLRLFRVPELLSAAFSLSLVAVVINFF